jgi:hypothetical protein
MTYRTHEGIPLDISAAGRGMLQVLMLLAFLYQNPGAIILLDEPDAHLEILRQREVYNLLTDVAKAQHGQVIAASHSEVWLTEAYSRDIAIAMLGKPRRIDSNQRRAQAQKMLEAIRITDYYQAAQTGWILYLEGATDLRILQAWARRLNHPVQEVLKAIFPYYLGTNQPKRVREHFYGLQDALPHVVGAALFDRLDQELPTDAENTLTWLMWRRREIENYFTTKETLLQYALDLGDMPSHQAAMDAVLLKFEAGFTYTRQDVSLWSSEVRASTEVLIPVFERYAEAIGIENPLHKTNFHILADFIPVDRIDPEVTEKLDAILTVAQKAQPL